MIAQPDSQAWVSEPCPLWVAISQSALPRLGVTGDEIAEAGHERNAGIILSREVYSVDWGRWNTNLLRSHCPAERV